jgi:hybrid cluster-associated redox disulfide protein
MMAEANEPVRLTAELTVTELLTTWPETAVVFIRRRMPCVGCEMSGFETLADVARSYDADLAGFLEELRAITASAGSGNQD